MINICNCYVKSSLWWNFFLKQWHYLITVLDIVLTTDKIKPGPSSKTSLWEDCCGWSPNVSSINQQNVIKVLVVWFVSFTISNVYKFLCFHKECFCQSRQKKAQNKFTWSCLTKCEVSATLCVITKFTHFSWFHTMQFLRKSVAIDKVLHSLV